MQKNKIDISSDNFYHKSKFTEDGVRYRLLRRKEAERYEYLGLERDPSATWFFRAYVYTLEQALEKGIKFREDWKEENPDIEKEYFGLHVFCQKDDWLKTAIPTPDGEYWVMQTLWRNENRSFPHIRVATGTYSWASKYGAKSFDGMDMETQYRMGARKPYEISDFRCGALSPREKLLSTFIVALIMQIGYYNRNVIKLAYHQAYGWFPTWIKVADIMRSEKIMSKVAEELALKLKDREMDMDFVLEQFKEMATNDYKDDPKRRERVTRLIGAMNEMPTYEVQHLNPGNNAKQVESLETLEALKALEE